ncbi:hypothetical protein [Nocardia sp. NBC_01327]|uniref:hypothetical protein n=1 Tax=Nocardia sp. NBC_01327 TaxID=2903593 RepID=UPI002E11DE57|nr:hypothetical protein OG326_24245 [Nocardia sp. NBC_01327]
MNPTETRAEYAEFSNAVAGALIEYAEAEGHRSPVFSARYRTAARAWLALHPDSQFGAEFGPWPDPSTDSGKTARGGCELMTCALTRQLRRILELTHMKARSAAEDLIDAGWTLPAGHPAGYVVGYVAQLPDDTVGPQLCTFSDDVLPTTEAGRAEFANALAWRPGWHLYALVDVTEEMTE